MMKMARAARRVSIKSVVIWREGEGQARGACEAALRWII